MSILHHCQRNSKTLLLTCLYRGHLYNLYEQYSDDIVRSHAEFAQHNGFDYAVAGDEINDIYGLTEWRDTRIDARCDCLGMNKWYAMHHMFERYGYDEILLVDFDSKFLRNTDIDLGDTDIKMTRLTDSPYYDSVWFLYYCIHRGVTTQQLETAPPYKGNTGFIKVHRDFFTLQDLDDFVDFSCRTLSNVKFGERTGWMGMHNADMARIHEIGNTTLTPFDEVFLVYQIMTTGAGVEYFDKRWNVNNVDLLKPDSAHIHFCTDKQRDMPAMCKPGIAKFLNATN